MSQPPGRAEGSAAGATPAGVPGGNANPSHADHNGSSPAPFHEPHAGPEPLDAAERRDVYEGALDRIHYLTQLADGKAAPLLALQATLAAVTIATASNFEDLFAQPDTRVALAVVLLATYVTSAITVLGLSLSVYFPQLNHGRGSVLFFEDVRHMNFDDYAHKSRGISHDEVEDDLLAMIHASSRITSIKFHQLRWAFALSAIGLAAWLPLMAWAGF